MSILLRSLVNEDEPVKTFDVEAAYLLLLPLLTVIVVNAPLLLPLTSPYDDDATDLQRMFNEKRSHIRGHITSLLQSRPRYKFTLEDLPRSRSSTLTLSRP